MTTHGLIHLGIPDIDGAVPGAGVQQALASPRNARDGHGVTGHAEQALPGDRVPDL